MHRQVKQWIASNIQRFEIIERVCPDCKIERLSTFPGYIAACEGTVPGLPFKFDVLATVPAAMASVWRAVEVVHTHSVDDAKLRQVHEVYPCDVSRVLQVAASDFMDIRGVFVARTRVRELFCNMVQCQGCEGPVKRPRTSGAQSAPTTAVNYMDTPLIDCGMNEPESADAIQLSAVVAEKIIERSKSQPLSEGVVVRVTAVAGAGKTTLIKKYIQALPEESSTLVLMFNRAPCDEMSAFIREIGVEKSVHSKTIDTFVGADYRRPESPIECIAKPSHKLDPDNTCKWCSDHVGKGLKAFYTTLNALPGHQDCDTKFVNSRTPPMKVDRAMQSQWSLQKTQMAAGEKYPCAAVCRYLYEERNLNLQKLSQYTHIIVDEVQDLSRVEAALFTQRLPGKITLVVGDPLQCINQFRGAALQVMEDIDVDDDHELPCTFRYGFPLNKFVEKVVKEWGCNYGDNYKTFRAVSGAGQGTQVVQVGGLKSTRGICEGVIHCIFRFNKSIMEHLLQMVENNETMRVSVDKAFHGKFLEDSHFLEDLCRLSLGLRTTAKKFKWYRGADGFEKYRKSTITRNEKDETLLCNFVDGQASKILHLLPKIKEMAQLHDPHADIHFHTAHGTKGATYEHVYLGDGFSTETREELNILYVALTRAQQTCYVHDDTFAVAFEGEGGVTTSPR